ncbi:ABC transporter ATP-binding protein [Candidatus Lokiarchaeum ossiferum]|uniref:ABC transporter ATP-binding protein n=1 Tax=Candidatus Lokiarchaeum ossiferum TaxID=2951803 RepID=UPI00352F9CBF
MIKTETQNNLDKDRQNRAVISMQDIRKQYGKGDLMIEAVKGINLDIDYGNIVTIMGPSGSGKSTFLNILGTMDKPTTGRVFIEGIDVAQIKERNISQYRKKLIGFVFQNNYLLQNLNVIDNILSPLIPYGISSDDKKRALMLIEKLGLEGREKSTVKKLSGGQAQRVAIARALINQPRILLADEPTGNLDSETGKEIIETLISLSKSGTTIIIVTHDPRIGQMIEMQENGRNIWLEDGKLSDKPSYDVFCYDTEK